MSAVLIEPFRYLRKMRDSDLEQVMKIEEAVCFYPWSLQIFYDCLRAGHHARILEQEFRLVGYGVMSTGASEAHILNLCVHPTYQRQGCGRYLLEHLLTIAKKEADTLFLEVRISNQAAYHLYTQMGFNQVGIRKNYYPARNGPEDAFILAMAL